MALMILWDDPIHETIRLIVEDFQTQDTDNYGCIQITLFENILWNYEKKFYEGELEEIKKVLLQKFTKGTEFWYNLKDHIGMSQFADTIIRYRADIITKGLIENDRNQLETYLIGYLERYDTGKTGLITQGRLAQRAQSRREVRFDRPRRKRG
jgi:Ca2+-binding EF-hand superfamily protein